jgi:hypothetical protein
VFADAESGLREGLFDVKDASAHHAPTRPWPPGLAQAQHASGMCRKQHLASLIGPHPSCPGLNLARPLAEPQLK